MGPYHLQISDHFRLLSIPSSLQQFRLRDFDLELFPLHLFFPRLRYFGKDNPIIKHRRSVFFQIHLLNPER
jgi:hypothetical protein